MYNQTKLGKITNQLVPSPFLLYCMMYLEICILHLDGSNTGAVPNGDAVSNFSSLALILLDFAIFGSSFDLEILYTWQSGPNFSSWK